jgi:hypothetical protein
VSQPYFKRPVPSNAADLPAWLAVELGNIQRALQVPTGTAPPTTGTYHVGDRVVNSVPTVGQPKAWVCTADGTPGTWVSEGNL